MTYYYIYSIIAYPLFLWSIIEIHNNHSENAFVIFMMSIVLLILKDILICQQLRTSSKMKDGGE